MTTVLAELLVIDPLATLRRPLSMAAAFAAAMAVVLVAAVIAGVLNAALALLHPRRT